MITTGAAARTEQLTARELVQRTLDTLEVTDRVYHELHRTRPLVEALIDAVTPLGPSRLVVVAPSELLVAALVSAGHSVEVWRAEPSQLGERAAGLTTRRGALDEILVQPVDAVDAMLMPYVLESAAEEPPVLLKRHAAARRFVIASRHTGALLYRRRAFARRPLVDAADEPRLSLAWPALSARRVPRPALLREWAEAAGLAIERQGFVVDRTAVSPVQAMSVASYAGALAKQGVKHLLPPMRDCVLATMVREGGR